MITVTLDGKNYRYYSSVRLGDVIREHCDRYCVAVLVNGRLYDLDKVIDSDCEVEPVDLTSEDGMRIYMRTLKYVFIMAVRKLFPNAEVRFMYSISRGQYCEIDGVQLDIDKVRSIEETMLSIIKHDVPFEKKLISRSEADKIYGFCYPDKADLLKYRPEDSVHVYKCGKEYNYLYGYMMTSTGYLRCFKLHFNSPGVVLLYPRHELGGQIPDFEPSVKFDKALWRAEEWGKICGVTNISQLNSEIQRGNIRNVVNMSEIRHENEIERIASDIAEDLKNIKVILIAGPSSSGKTTLSMKLRAHLAVKGIRAFTISTDDYFIDKELCVDADGSVDFEHINRINIKRFNDDLVNLIAGKSVMLPSYNFVTGKSEEGNTIKIGSDECIIVEGIHGLNEALTPLVPRYNKYKIFISALTHINIDNHTPVSTTTCRLIRRIVRDNLYRNTRIEETLAMWESVRRGEFRWIYPYQEEADYIFNSELTYELAVLKKHVMPLIENMNTSSKYYIQSNKIMKILKYVESVEDNVVPNTSILREFIGGSNY